jgi:hypothetical protein
VRKSWSEALSGDPGGASRLPGVSILNGSSTVRLEERPSSARDPHTPLTSGAAVCATRGAGTHFPPCRRMRSGARSS